MQTVNDPMPLGRDHVCSEISRHPDNNCTQLLVAPDFPLLWTQVFFSAWILPDESEVDCIKDQANLCAEPCMRFGPRNLRDRQHPDFIMQTVGRRKTPVSDTLSVITYTLSFHPALISFLDGWNVCGIVVASLHVFFAHHAAVLEKGMGVCTRAAV